MNIWLYRASAKAFRTTNFCSLARSEGPVQLALSSGLPPATYVYTVPVFLKFVTILLLTTFASAANTPPAPVLRWSQTDPHCTVRTGQDGHTHYTLAGSNFEITLAVDQQELAKVPHRSLPMLSVLLTFRFTGTGHLDVEQNRFTLEYVKNSHVIQSSLDPDGMVASIQSNMDELTDEMNHRVRKHPDQQKKNEPELQARLKDYTDMMDFVSTRALRQTTLSPSNSTVSGWVFFSTKNRWIGNLRPPQDFVLRLPVNELWVEFPFELPPKAGKIELRHRPAE